MNLAKLRRAQAKKTVSEQLKFHLITSVKHDTQ